MSPFIRVIVKHSTYLMGLIASLANMNTGWISLIREDLLMLSVHDKFSDFRGLPLPQALALVNQDPRYHHKAFRDT